MIRNSALLISALLTPTVASAAPVPLGRGINVLGYDPLWKGNPPKFTYADFGRIRAAGFNTVRINVRPFAEIMRPDNSLRPQWVKVMQGFVDAGLKSGLTVILDYHDTDNKCSTSFESCLPRLKAFWRQVAHQYSAYPNKLVFEILNEPHEPLSEDLWNSAQREILAILRRTNPNRSIIVSPTGYSAIGKLRFLDLPDDKYLIATVHYYEPRNFTMQFKPATGRGGQPIFVNWGTPADRQKLNKDFDLASGWSRAHRLPIFVGEFGVWDTVPIESRSVYLNAVVNAAEQRGFSWAEWQYLYDFRAIDPKTGTWLAPVLRALTTPKR